MYVLIGYWLFDFELYFT